MFEFEGPTLEIARRLIGARLVHDSPAGRTVGRIVETEAYLAVDDPASHSAKGPTARNASMFLSAGHAYVYLIYGVHLCFNVVTGRAEVGEAVLVRALEPLEGESLMASRRATEEPRHWCSGPGKLVQAMGIERSQDGDRIDERGGALRILAPESAWDRPEIIATPRIGIREATDLDYRFVVAESQWPSR